MISENQLRKIRSGKILQLSHDQLQSLYDNMPNLSSSNEKKIIKAFRTGKGCRINFDEEELHGSGFVKQIKKAGKFIHDNNIDDLIVNEAVNQLPIPAVGKKIASKVINKGIDKMYGGKLQNNNPYLPDELHGGSLIVSKKRLNTYADMKEIVRPDQDAYNVNPEFFMQGNKLNTKLYGKGFSVKTY
jgi:hypothetical protein